MYGKWLAWLAIMLILAGQVAYWPSRMAFWRRVLTFTHLEEPLKKKRLAYGAADYDLLAWVDQETSPGTTLLLLTSSPETYGDPSYVLYHRALYHLYPRTVWWAAPVPHRQYPVWWIFTDLSPSHILALAERYRVTVVLADGFLTPPFPGDVLSYDDDTHLIRLGNQE